jgi:diguanylate cyclase (GGDEF)-like protein
VPEELSLLIVEDEDPVRMMMLELLGDEVGTVHGAANGVEALAMLERLTVDAIITDIEMPMMGGLELARQVRMTDAHLPIVALSAYDHTEYLKEGYRAGVDIYHTKPIFDIDIIVDDCLKLCKEYRAIRQDREELATMARENEQLRNHALRDSLTGIYNRDGVSEHFNMLLGISSRTVEPMTVVMIDIDDFKPINDTYGHNIGDAVICKVAEVLEAHTREADLVGRWGGEEFIMILSFTDEAGVTTLLERIRAQIDSSVSANDLPVTVSIGYTVFDPASCDVRPECHSCLVEQADAAMYRAKAAGKNCIIGHRDPHKEDSCLHP